jgi:hypothetical protein
MDPKQGLGGRGGPTLVLLSWEGPNIIFFFFFTIKFFFFHNWGDHGPSRFPNPSLTRGLALQIYEKR